MIKRTVKNLGVGCIIFAILLCALTPLSQPVRAANSATVTVGGVPYSVVFTPDGNYAYVPNTDNVSVINTATNKVVAVVTGQNWPVGVAITPDGKYAYVTDTNTATNQDGLVSVISTSTNTVTATITIGGNPNQGVAITPNGEYVYVTNYDGAVTVISTATHTVTANITIGTQSASPVTNVGANIITVGGPIIPQAVAITPNGECAYAANSDGTVSVINTTTNTVTATVTLGDGDNAYAVAITPNGENAYVCVNSTAVSVISTATNTVTATIGGFDQPNGIAITPDGKYAYVTNYFNDSVSVISTATNTVDKTVSAGSSPYGIAITPNGEYAYVTNLASVATNSPVADWIGAVSVISTNMNASPTDSSSPAVPEFSGQLLTIVMLVCVVIVLSAVLIAMKIAERANLAKISRGKQTPEGTRLTNEET